MAYNTKAIVRDVDGNPISQYYNEQTDTYEAVEGLSGSNKIVLYDESGKISEQLNLDPVILTLERLTGTVIDEETRKDSESIRITNEGNRVSQENVRLGDEKSRVDSEVIRQSQEDNRRASEQIRIDAEDIRRSDETIRISSENQRVLEETTRQSQEAERESNENTRQSNEAIRVPREDKRISDEGTRQAQEDIRKEAESNRLTNESARQGEEIARQTNESERQLNELARVDNMNIVEEWITNPGQFNGKNIEYTWRNTELGVRLSGDTAYEYVELKGETGNIDNLTAHHIQNALGFIPTDYSAGTNISIDNGSISVVGQLGLSEAEVNNKIENHIPANVKFNDLKNNKKYMIGFQVSENGQPQITYKEVM